MKVVPLQEREQQVALPGSDSYSRYGLTGSDSNSGSASAPWLTIKHAALQATAGSTVYVGAGTYNESVTFANSGTSTAPIIFNGQGVAIVDGPGRHRRRCD